MIPTDEPFVLFLRHAERAAIPVDAPYADVDLTPQGYASVSALAEVLCERLHWSAASAFLRCVVTARGLGREPERDARLGMHGPWIVDTVQAEREFLARGVEGVVRAQVEGQALAGFRQASEAVPLLLSAGLDRIHRGSGVCISHDAILMPAMAWLFGPDAAENWLAPLDGFALTMRDAIPIAVWRGRVRQW